MRKYTGILVRQTKNGPRYEVKWRRADGTQASRTFRTLREARDHKRSTDSDKARGILPDDRLGRVTFAVFAAEVNAAQQHGESTVRRREGIMRKHLLPAFGHRPISKISRAEILTQVRRWELDGLAPRSIRNQLNVLRRIFHEAFLRDIVIRSPLDGVKPPKASTVKKNPLTPEQCNALLDSVDPKYRFAIEFVLATGVRWSEFANMRIRDFDALRNTVRVAKSKTDAGIREIPLHRSDTLMISRHIASTNRTGADADSPLFTSPDGKPLNHSNFAQRVFKPACERAGLVGVTFHTLRQTHATMLVEAGFDPKVIQDRMGHKSITTTLTFYAEATRKGRESAAGVKGRYLGSAEPDELRDAR